jgi:hypothetical protein
MYPNPFLKIENGFVRSRNELTAPRMTIMDTIYEVNEDNYDDAMDDYFDYLDYLEWMYD